MREAKRFCPEALNFLTGVLNLASGRSTEALPATIDTVAKNPSICKLAATMRGEIEPLDVTLISGTTSGKSTAASPAVALSCIAAALRLATAFLSLYTDHACEPWAWALLFLYLLLSFKSYATNGVVELRLALFHSPPRASVSRAARHHAGRRPSAAPSRGSVATDRSSRERALWQHARAASSAAGPAPAPAAHAHAGL